MNSDNTLKENDIKNHPYCYINDFVILMDINDFNPKNIKVDTKLYKDVLVFYVGYEKLNGAEPLYINFDKINGYIEGNNRSKYLTVILVEENKGEIKRYIETWNRIKYLTDLKTWENFIINTLEMHNAVIIILSVFYDNKYFPQVFLD